MNQRIDNALGGYDESVATDGGEQGDCLANAGSAAAPDTLLEQVKELRPKVTQGEWDCVEGVIGRACGVRAECGYIAFAAPLTHFAGQDDRYAKEKEEWLANMLLFSLAPQMADRIIADAARIEALEAENKVMRDCWLNVAKSCYMNVHGQKHTIRKNIAKVFGKDWVAMIRPYCEPKESENKQ